MDVSKKLESTKKMIRAVLLSCKDGVQANRLQSDFKSLTGGGIPFQKLGFNSVHELIQSIPDVVRINERFGETMYHAVADDSTKHIQKMVSSQRSAKKKSKRGYRCSKANQSFNRYASRTTTRHHGQRKVLLTTPNSQRKGLLPTPTVRHFPPYSGRRVVSSNIQHAPVTGARVITTHKQHVSSTGSSYMQRQNKMREVHLSKKGGDFSVKVSNNTAAAVAPRFRNIPIPSSGTSHWKSEKINLDKDTSKDVKMSDVIKIRIKTLLGSNPSGVFSNTLPKLYFDAYGCKLADSVVYALEGGAIRDVATVEKLTCGIREKTILYPIKQSSPIKSKTKPITASGSTGVKHAIKIVPSKLSKDQMKQMCNQDKLNNNKAQPNQSQSTSSAINNENADIVTWKSERVILSAEMKDMVIQIKDTVKNRIKSVTAKYPFGISSAEFETVYHATFNSKFPDVILKNLECGLVEDVVEVEKLTKGNREKIIFHPLKNKPKIEAAKGVVADACDDKENYISDAVKQRIKRILSACPRGITPARLLTAYSETYKVELNQDVIRKMEKGLLCDVTNIKRIENDSKIIFLPRKAEIIQQGPKYPALSEKNFNKVPEAGVLRIGTEHEAHITHIVDCGKFYIQVSESASDLKTIQELSKHAKYGTITNLSTGMETISWIESGGRRGRIITVSGNKAKVYHMDFGVEQEMHRQHLAPMLQEIKSIPEMAILCSLHKPDESVDWSERASSKFNHLFLGKTIKATVDSVLKQSVDGVSKIVYYVTCKLGSLNINQRLMKEEEQIDEYHIFNSQTDLGLSEEENDESDTSYVTIDSDLSDCDEPAVEISMHALSRIDSMNSTNICEESMDISNSSFHHDDEIWTQTQQKVTGAIASSSGSEDKLSFPSKPMSESSFGNHSSRYKLVRNQKPFSPMRSHSPLNVSNFQAHTKPVKNSESARSNSNYSLSRQSLNKSCHIPSRILKSSCSLSMAIKKMQQWRFKACNTDDATSDKEDTGSNIVYMTSPSPIPLMKKHFGKLVSVIVTKIQSPGTFFMVLSEMLPTLHDLTSQMNEYYIPMSSTTVSSATITEESLYAAPCEVDNIVRWHRVKVCKIVQNLASVFLIDLGTRDCVPIDRIYQLLPQFVQHAPFAIHGRLAGIRPVHLSTENVQKATKLLEEWVTEKKLTAHIVKTTPAKGQLVYDVCLYNANEDENGKWLNDLMVDTWKVAEYIVDVAA
ncbi:uncharacterized protein LOC120339020 [Styela clava]